MKNTRTFHSETAKLFVSVDTDSKKVKFKFELTDKGVSGGYGMAHWLDSVMLLIGEGLVEIYHDRPRLMAELFISAVKRYDGGAQNSIRWNLEDDEVGAWALDHVSEDAICGPQNFEVELDLNAWLFKAMRQASELDRIENAWAEYYAQQARELEEDEYYEEEG